MAHTISDSCDGLKAKLKPLLLNAFNEDKKYKLIIILWCSYGIERSKTKPGITTSKFAEIIKKHPQTVQRYIRTLGCAGKLIQYSNRTHGWSLKGNMLILPGDFN